MDDADYGQGDDVDEDVNDGAIAGKGGAAEGDDEPVAVDDDGWCELGAFSDECMVDGETGEARAKALAEFAWQHDEAVKSGGAGNGGLAAPKIPTDG